MTKTIYELWHLDGRKLPGEVDLIEGNKILATMPDGWYLHNVREQELPCNFDHNGECLVCDCTPSECAFDRLAEGNFKYESLDELLEMFKDFITEDKAKELRDKYGGK